jgi:signal transduction histidine kinase
LSTAASNRSASVCDGELISDVAQKFELTARTREVNLHIDVPGPLPLVNADVSMIERVVTNLLDNAMRHTPRRGNSSGGVAGE